MFSLRVVDNLCSCVYNSLGYIMLYPGYRPNRVFGSAASEVGSPFCLEEAPCVVRIS